MVVSGGLCLKPLEIGMSSSLNRRAKQGVLEGVFNAVGGERLLLSEVCSLDSTMVETHPDVHGAEKTMHG
jgi:hypothetical protein